jgi:hypothetical protein
MQFTLVSAVVVLGLAMPIVLTAWRARRRHRKSPEARYRNDIRALKRRPRTPMINHDYRDLDQW